MDAVIPVTVVTGFLGAGKSTLLERWLVDLPRDDTVVIINEQGDVGIDGALLAGRSSRILEITGGCICCTTQAALADALAEFAESTPAPTRILVETSGAASPAGVIRVLTRGRARRRLRLDGVVTVIDATRAHQAIRFGLTVEQLGFADIVVMSHADECAEGALVQLGNELAHYAPGAVFARAAKGTLASPGAETLLCLLAARGQVLRVLPLENPEVTRHGIDAVSLVHDGELDEARFGEWVERALGSIEVRILRIKGILAVSGVQERLILQGVSESIEVTFGLAWGEAQRTSRLVILGLGLDEVALRTGFAACAL